MSTPAILATSLFSPLSLLVFPPGRSHVRSCLASSLPLLVFGRLRADHPHNTVALDDPAARTHLSDRRPYLHLQISRIRPRDRSSVASSTPTLSPARSRVKWVPARSAT